MNWEIRRKVIGIGIDRVAESGRQKSEKGLIIIKTLAEKGKRKGIGTGNAGITVAILHQNQDINPILLIVRRQLKLPRYPLDEPVDGA